MIGTRNLCVLVALVILVTLSISFGAHVGHGQQKGIHSNPTPTPETKDTRDLSKYGSVRYDDPENLTPNKQRRRKNQRYDNQEWVYKTITNPNAGGVGKITDDPLAPAFPVKESSLIVAGDVVAVRTFLSNNLRGVYSEFTIRPDDVLKDSNKIASKTIIADREGGVVIYPNGQRMMYHSSSLALPKLDGKYLFFLAKRDESPNYEIRTAYYIGGEKVYRLEFDGKYDESKLPLKSQLLEIVRNKIAGKIL
jgi:hypothetical protein